MDLRDSKSRLILIVVALGAALVIAVASCSGGDSDAGGDAANGDTAQASGGTGDSDGGQQDDDAPGEDEPDDAGSGEVLAQSTGEDNITLTFTRAEREAGGFLTVEGTLHNGSGSKWGTATWAGSERELVSNDFSMAGATLTAREEGKRYLILRDTSGRCLCTGFGLLVDAGDTVTWFAQFPEPDPATSEVDFQIGQMPPVTLPLR
ncbi:MULTISPECIES: hypothetical protein [Streptomyces]|jgi:hypothetical protein|uniref:hypothetical protein n=1 Tax=Streptomyces TaxID=1883 RepID=UPI001905331D|nr:MULTISPECIES: hypothetical protein [unclassified Streptomyces]MCU4746954.1 hypothetical protein [Streptomyces sp. G-5]QQN77644.1 hypothetical protein IPZ77_09435 [Streptomyces sp. XC 2026]